MSGQLDLFAELAPAVAPAPPAATVDVRAVLRSRPPTTQPRLPGRRAFAPPSDGDGRLLVDLSTGEIFETAPSATRAARLAARAAAHEARVADERAAAAERRRRWIPIARAALPARTPPGLQR